MTRAVLAVALNALAASACWKLGGVQDTRLQARPSAPTAAIEAGEYPLGLGGDRDGTLYIPKSAVSQPAPLLVLMHGAGQDKSLFRPVFPMAEEAGVVILALDSRDATWDGIRGAFGPDVTFIDAALRHTFERVAVDPRRLALGGFSDGASYGLSLGLMNGDLFTHLIAFSPGFINKPGESNGRPKIFVSHGTRDAILDIDRSSRQLVPQLKRDGYSVTYQEFDGPHTAPPPIERMALEWLKSNR